MAVADGLGEQRAKVAGVVAIAAAGQVGDHRGRYGIAARLQRLGYSAASDHGMQFRRPGTDEELVNLPGPERQLVDRLR